MHRSVTAGLIAAAALFTGSGIARADTDGSIIIDFVRHGEAGDNTVINTLVPGPDLTAAGEGQAALLPDKMDVSGINEIWASTMIRSQETAAPLADSLNITYPLDPDHLLSGLNEINAGIFEGAPVGVGDVPLGGALYLLAPALWTLGLTSFPELGSTDANGIVFDARVDQAIQTIYDGSTTNGVDAVFSHEGTIAIWTLMNVNNPDFGLVLKDLFTTGELLPYTGQVVVDGSPGDWTLVSWDGTAVPSDPGLPTDLFVDFRNFIEVPQLVNYDIYEALLTGNAATIDSAIQTGFSQLDAALMQFPVAVFDDFVTALGGSI
jgi:broad specificity phosphatase PhoE